MFTICCIVCRTITKEHIPKKHHDFDNPIHSTKVFDNTANRIYGESKPEIMTTNNTEYGTAKHSTAGITRIGRKTDMMEREIANAVAKEMQERRDAIARKQQERYFDTTNAENLTPQDMTANTVGRKVMQTQDGKLVAAESRDENLIVETGMYRRT